MASPDPVVSVDRFVPHPPARVFALLSDPHRHADLDGSGTVRRVRTSDGPLRAGSHFDMHMHRGFSYSTRNTVTELEPDRRIAWSTRPITPPLSWLIGGRTWTYDLVAEPGGTRVTETWDVRPERNGWFVRPLAGDPGADMRATLDRLAEVLDESAA